jgi:hypothetical protein
LAAYGLPAGAFPAALLVVRDEREELQTAWEQHPGWLGVTLTTPQGTGAAWAQFRPDAAAPPGVKARMLFTQWKPRNGPAEALAV